jgi:hypothetical protein
MHTPWLLVAHHMEYFFCWHPRNIDNFLFKRKRRKRNRKRKGNHFPPRLGRIQSTSLSRPPSRARALPSLAAHLPRGALPHWHPGPTRQPALPSLATASLTDIPAPPVSPFSPSPVTRPPVRSPPATVRPISSPLTHSLARLAPCAPAHCVRAVPSPPPTRAVSSPFCANTTVMASSSVLTAPPPIPLPGHL